MSNLRQVVVIAGEGIDVRTRDIMHAGGTAVGTSAMGDAVLAALERAG